jgi:PAS domain S-box-containing protein
MKTNDKQPDAAAELRQRAEAAFREKAATATPESLAALTPEAARQLLHELQVHQIELEMQNEELRRAQLELDAARTRYFDLYDLAPVGYCTLNETGLILEANLTLATELGVARGVLVSQPFSRFIHKEDARRFYLLGKQLLATGQPQMCEVRMVSPAGPQFWALLAATAAPPGMRVVLSDITEGKRMEDELKTSEKRYRRLFEESLDGICLADAQTGIILDINPALSKLVGRERHDLVGQSQRILHPPGEAVGEVSRSFGQHRHEKSGQILAVPVITKAGEVRTAEIIANVREVQGRQLMVGIFRDITEQKKLEAQLRRTQRLASIGTLAGGIAHNLNNALAPIMMSAELLRAEFPDTASGLLEIIQASTKRGADMVKQLLTFAKGIEGERLLLQPRHLLKEMEKLIQNTFLKEIELRTHYPKDLWTILGDATQLHQVLLNLCINARDAMPGGGTLTLAAENQELDAVYASTVPEAKPGRYVVWRVKDTGTGIPPEVLDRIFDPFFTTKGPDKGTGLGLSTTLGIVKSHGGFIRVSSIPGQGSTFAVYLPACGADASGTALLTKADAAFRGHGETILLVDDEADVRNMLCAILTKFNFKVLTAGDGADALLQVTEHQTELRAVITDLHMPNMDGLSFVRVLKGRLPGAGIIVASGRMEEREENEFKQLGVHAVLHKPFALEQLVEALKTVFQK